MDVAEGLVAARQRHDVGAGVPALGIGPGAEPDDSLADPQARSQRLVLTGIALAENDQTTAAIGKRRERLDGGREALAREAAAHEEDREGARGNADLAAHGLPVPPTIPGMEAVEVDPVVDDGHPARRHAVQHLDLAPSGLGDRDDTRRAREDAALEGQNDPVIEPAGPRPRLAREIRSM